MRTGLLAHVWCAGEKRTDVEASEMRPARARPGAPPPRHCAKIPRPRTTHSTRLRKSEAKTLRHRLVVQGLVVTRRAMSPPLLQQTAAQATSRTPRRLEGVAGSRRVATESGATGVPSSLDRMCYM